MGSNDCLSLEQLTRYLENRLEVDLRGRVEEHLSHCQACRRRLTESYEEGVSLPDVQAPEDLKRRVLKLPGDTSQARRWMALAAVLVAGLGLAVLLDPVSRDPVNPDPGTLRAPPQGAPQALELELLTPTSGVLETSGDRVFEWRGVPEARRYTLSIMNALGDVIYRETTPELSLIPPVGVLETEREYFWYVTAVLEDGTRLESEVWSFMRREQVPGT